MGGIFPVLPGWMKDKEVDCWTWGWGKWVNQRSPEGPIYGRFNKGVCVGKPVPLCNLQCAPTFYDLKR